MNKLKKGSLVPSRPGRFDVTCQACREIRARFQASSGNPPVARTSPGTRLKDRVWEVKEKGVVTAFTA